MKKIGYGLIAVVMLLLAANGIMAWRVSARSAAKVAAIRAAGQPASIAELKPAPIPDAVNAAAQLAALDPLMKGWNRENDLFYRSDLGKVSQERASGAPLTDEQADAIRAINAKYPQIGEGFERAAACTRWASRGDFSLDAQTFLTKNLENIQKIRQPVRFVLWAGMLAAHDGDVDEAVRKGIEVLHVGRLAENEPTMTAMLIAIAVQLSSMDELNAALASGKVSPEVRAALDAQLAECDDSQSMVRALVTERAYSLDATDQMMASGHPKLAAFALWKVKSFFLEGLDFYDVALPNAGKAWWETGGHIDRTGSTGPMSAAVQQVLPGVQAAYGAVNRRQALVRALRVLNALQEFEEKNGRAATGLSDLSLPAAAMVDPYSGKQLLLKKSAKGWIVYSVGQDGKDDGGDLGDKGADLGVGVQ